MARKYETSERVERVAKGLIAKHHKHLKGASIAYVMKKLDEEAEAKAAKPGRNGKHPKAARARAVPALYNLLTDGLNFVIEVDERYWDLFTLQQQEALIDHELAHCRQDEKGFYIADHDVEEFRSILERHGFWRPGLEDFVAAAAQRALPFDGGAEGAGAVQ